MNIEKYNKKFRWIKNLKDKKNPNDNKKTPLELAIELIKITPFKKGDLVFDGFYGNGVWYNNYPTYVRKKWSEINPKHTPNNKSIDFFAEADKMIVNNEKVDWICSNIPFSKFNDILEKSVKIARKGIAFLVGIMNISPKRLKMLEDNNFGITTFHLSQVTGWLGCSVYFIAEKNKPSIIKYTRKIYQMPEDERKIYIKKQKKYQADYYIKNFQTKLKNFRSNNKKIKNLNTKKKNKNYT